MLAARFDRFFDPARMHGAAQLARELGDVAAPLRAPQGGEAFQDEGESQDRQRHEKRHQISALLDELGKQEFEDGDRYQDREYEQGNEYVAFHDLPPIGSMDSEERGPSAGPPLRASSTVSNVLSSNDNLVIRNTFLIRRDGRAMRSQPFCF